MKEVSTKISLSEKLFQKLDALAYDFINHKTDDIADEFHLTFERLYKQCIVDCFFWQYCPLEVYKKSFEYRQTEYLTKFIDATKIDFITHELQVINSSIQKSKFEGYSKKVNHFVWELKGDRELWDICLLDIEQFISSDIRQQITYSYARKYEFLEILYREEEILEQPQKLSISDNYKDDNEINPYPRIFPKPKHFELFEHWHNAVIENELAEYSFIYRQMIMDEFIYDDIKPTEFINWLNNTYGIALDELKQYNNCKGGGKITRYQTAKLLFK